MATQPESLYTFEQYLDRERQASGKSEFHAGQIFAMSGGTEQHSRLAVRMISVLDARLDHCRVYDSNLRIYIEQFDRGVYPDCSVLCGEPQFWRSQNDVIVNPALVVEVLSASTEKYDRSDKSNYYRSIPSLQHILLISQDQAYVEHFLREGRSWKVDHFTQMEEAIALLGVSITLGDIYRGILDSV